MTDSIYRGLDSSAWADPDVFECPCRSGWFLSDFDTWHRCHEHGVGVPDPEDEEADFDFPAHALAMARQTFRWYNEEARRLGLTNFKADIQAALRDIASPTPKDYCKAAREVVAKAAEEAARVAYEAADAAAQARGYSCALEESWAIEAEQERHGYHGF